MDTLSTIFTSANRQTLWDEHVSKQTDQIAVLLEKLMLANAPYSMRALKAAHARADGSERVDGGAWYRALVAKKGTLNKEETQKQCGLRLDWLKQNPLPANARGADFASSESAVWSDNAAKLCELES